MSKKTTAPATGAAAEAPAAQEIKPVTTAQAYQIIGKVANVDRKISLNAKKANNSLKKVEELNKERDELIKPILETPQWKEYSASKEKQDASTEK